MTLIAWFGIIVAIMLGAIVVLGNPAISPSLSSFTPESKTENEINTEMIAYEIHNEVNEVRDLYGLNSLSWNSKIADIAAKHSKDMSVRNYFNHISPEGSDVVDRFKQANFVCDRKLPNGDILKGGENLAQVTYSEDTNGVAVRIVQSWMDSPAHKENLLFEGYATEGIGIVFSDYTLHITQNFC